VQSGIVGGLLGGWQLNGVWTMHSGTPFSVFANGISPNAPGSIHLVKSSVVVLGNVGEY
jgi:hypothetical protein